MGMTMQSFGFDDVKRVLKKGIKVPDIVILRRLHYLGLEMTAHARTITPGHPQGYNDQTGNLRSSIGFAIYKDGERVDEGGYESTGGADGVQRAKNALNEYASEAVNASGWTLIIVAGMNYASAVESGKRKTRNGRFYQAKGYNVLHLTGVEMSKQIDEIIKEFKQGYQS